MLGHLTLIFCCQLLGEMLVAALGAPIPGPVAGMVLLLAGLLIAGHIPPELGALADGLLGNLSLLFIPAGVGVMLHARIIGRDWLPISVALVVSTAATIAVTALVLGWMSKTADAAGTARLGGDTPDA